MYHEREYNPLKDISTSDETALETLIENNPSLIKQIDQYFNSLSGRNPLDDDGFPQKKEFYG